MARNDGFATTGNVTMCDLGKQQIKAGVIFHIRRCGSLQK